jgi:pimeloyl-ACP methyl ester carboxylesterase
MGVTEIVLPRLGETMDEARVTDWLIAPGQDFARGDILLEVETDKTVVEVPALAAGRMVEHLAQVGDLVEIGCPIARIESEGPAAEAKASGQIASTAPPNAALAARPVPDVPTPVEPTGGRFAASPVARRKARAAGLSLEHIPGTGRRGRITGRDVAEALQAERPRQRHRVALPGGMIVHDRIDPPKDTGKATVVLIHGLFAEATAWRELPRRISGLGHKVVVPDLPGSGESTLDPPDLDALVAAMEAFLRAVLPHGPVILAGHSLGAYVAARLALGLGQRLQRLVLFAPVGLGARLSRDFLDTMTEMRTEASLLRGLDWLGPGAGRLSPERAALELSRAQAERPLRRRLCDEIAAGGIQQIDLARTLAPVARRTRAVFGLQDRVVAWHDAASLPAGVAVHFVAEAGHLPQLHCDAIVPDLLGDDSPRG